MHKSKKSFTLIETIIVLFIISIVFFSWHSFFSSTQKSSVNERLDDYFLTKKVFINAYNDSLFGNIVSDNREFYVSKNEEIFFVQLIKDGAIKEEIKVYLR
jgi:competence protein ComGC